MSLGLGAQTARSGATAAAAAAAGHAPLQGIKSKRVLRTIASQESVTGAGRTLVHLRHGLCHPAIQTARSAAAMPAQFFTHRTSPKGWVGVPDHQCRVCAAAHNHPPVCKRVREGAAVSRRSEQNQVERLNKPSRHCSQMISWRSECLMKDADSSPLLAVTHVTKSL